MGEWGFARRAQQFYTFVAKRRVLFTITVLGYDDDRAVTTYPKNIVRFLEPGLGVLGPRIGGARSHVPASTLFATWVSPWPVPVLYSWEGAEAPRVVNSVAQGAFEGGLDYYAGAQHS
jgi:hypothetical protein